MIITWIKSQNPWKTKSTRTLSEQEFHWIAHNFGIIWVTNLIWDLFFNLITHILINYLDSISCHFGVEIMLFWRWIMVWYQTSTLLVHVTICLRVTYIYIKCLKHDITSEILWKGYLGTVKMLTCQWLQ